MSSTENSRLKEAVSDFLDSHNVPPDSAILAAYSGGPDSTALLHILCNLDTRRVKTVSAVYVDHGIRSREEILLEKEIVRRTTAELGVTLYERSIPPGMIEEYARRMGTGVEAAARKFRYRKIRRIAARYGFEFIALGHNRNDHLETMIYRFFQSSGPGGLRGIPEKRGAFIRPLIETDRDTILSYLEETGTPYSVDSTNRDRIYLRNRVRSELLPVIREIFPGFESSLLETGARQDDLYRFVAGKADRSVRWESADGGWRSPLESVREIPPPVREQALYQLYNRGHSGLNPRSDSLPFYPRSFGENLSTGSGRCYRERVWAYTDRKGTLYIRQL